ncbi:MAG: hypothetical protein H0X24_19695 [Ktedonobacterales bacterium]|nr:hypothetical protein [Ktedonobacterales bacterium]
MPRYVVLLILLFMLFGCGTDSHVSGTVTSTTTWYSSYRCGSVRSRHSCSQRHRSFVVNGQTYQDDADDVRTGDQVRFDYNTVWGVSKMQDSTVHHDDYTAFLVVLGLIVVGSAAWIWYRRRDEPRGQMARA